ncbi:hypothetical protein TVAG_458730 [Trichomonas vaginalis G3]|uniref:Uncharacterized protein n=1 Tax=Trichomonas vaginalis (strain ATCC PRA-98 / G3) TaxID=412133 RepID=A2E678_TRIV3|nr:armadillo (ARM) repeat-containing protein family [Trichomonas vaginalis G3]EAY11801.1 hypothetical protein TVAG_458730 [Trichomonas vaginalis G3]KAI5534207.1 armadillo (ARM) repeat-containing protein family [Trichomonas vaginalis G3]|eukprot:XP_001324024.1 hypothetical protein [Trichomonas vaginalis G3]
MKIRELCVETLQKNQNETVIFDNSNQILSKKDNIDICFDELKTENDPTVGRVEINFLRQLIEKYYNEIAQSNYFNYILNRIIQIFQIEEVPNIIKTDIVEIIFPILSNKLLSWTELQEFVNNSYKEKIDLSLSIMIQITNILTDKNFDSYKEIIINIINSGFETQNFETIIKTTNLIGNISKFKEVELISYYKKAFELAKLNEQNYLLPMLKNMFPVLYLCTQLENSTEEKYFKFICEIIFKITNETVDFESDFEQSINTLSKYSSILNPKSPKDYIPFLKAYSKPPYSEFYLVTLSKLIQDPMTLVRIISELKFSNSNLYQDFHNERGSPEKFFDMYCTYLVYQIGAYDDSYWEIRLMIADLLVDMITKHINSIVLVDPMINFLRIKLVGLITDSPMNNSIPFIRLLLLLDKATLSRQTPEIIGRRLNTLLNNIKNGHPGNQMIIKFITKYYLNSIDLSEVIKSKYKQGLFSTSDFEILILPMRLFEKKASLTSIKLLSNLLVTHELWRKSAGYFLTKAILSSQYQDDVSDWFSKFILDLEASIRYRKSVSNEMVDGDLILQILRSKGFKQINFISERFDEIDSDEQLIENQIELIKKGKFDVQNLPFKGDTLNLFDETPSATGKGKGKKGKGKGKGKKRADSVPKKDEKKDSKKNAASDNEEDGKQPVHKEKAKKDEVKYEIKLDQPLPPRPKRKKGKKPVLTSELIKKQKEQQEKA